VNTFLMYINRSFTLQEGAQPNTDSLAQDLELNTVLDAMASKDEFLHDVARVALLTGTNDPQTILYRQDILRDCLAHESTVREIYNVAVEAIEGEKKEWRMTSSPGSVLYSSLIVMRLFVDSLARLRGIAEKNSEGFTSDGFVRFFEMVRREISDDYLRTVKHHLDSLEFNKGVFISAKLGKGNKGVQYTLHCQPRRKRGWLRRILGRGQSALSFEIGDRDESGAMALSELRDKGINQVANVLAQSVDSILNFFNVLRRELGFYICCLNLHHRLTRLGEPVCFPIPAGSGTRVLHAEDLYDVSLALRIGKVVGNNITADGKQLVFVTGANQGGKSTFLRSVGLAYLMMQCGMFVGARSFSAEVSNGVFTHFRREEDATMTSGKLEEELRRMSEIVDRIGPGCVLLCNESFSSTNEREGSEIARQVVGALIEAGVRILFVTHFFDLAYRFYKLRLNNALFLRAERLEDGRRTFKIIEGEPLPVSYSQDLYREIFVETESVTATPSFTNG